MNMKKASLSRKTNRTSNPDSLNQNGRPPRSRWILPFAGFAILAVGFGVWTLAQPFPQPGPNQDPIKARLGEPDESPEKRAERELARLAILEPAAFEAMARTLKTAQELQDEEIAKFAISQPKAYSTEFEKFKTPERRSLEAQARAAILNPVAHSGPVPRKARAQQPNQNSNAKNNNSP